MRLNVFLQKAGVGSRRQAEKLVADGRVCVNDAVAEPTTPVEDGDKVFVDDTEVKPDTRPVPRLFKLYKPLDVLVTAYDSQRRTVIYDLPALKRKNLPRLMYVGRLDVNSEGLLLLSSDGPLAQALMNPKSELERIYRIRVHGRLTPHQIERLAKGVTVKGVQYRGAKVTEERAPKGKNTWYRIVLTEGKNREVRKLMEHFGCVVNRLIRVSYGPYELGNMEAGQLVEVPHKDVTKLMHELRKRGAEF